MSDCIRKKQNVSQTISSKSLVKNLNNLYTDKNVFCFLFINQNYYTEGLFVLKRTVWNQIWVDFPVFSDTTSVWSASSEVREPCKGLYTQRTNTSWKYRSGSFFFQMTTNYLQPWFIKIFITEMMEKSFTCVCEAFAQHKQTITSWK